MLLWNIKTIIIWKTRKTNTKRTMNEEDLNLFFAEDDVWKRSYVAYFLSRFL